MVDTAMEEFHADYQRLFDKESALAFNETLAAFLQDQKLRTFVCALHTLCEGEKAALIPSMKKVLPANLQGPFQNAWDLAQQGIIDAETPDSKVTDDSDHSVLYLGSAGLMAVPSGEKDDMTLLNRVLTQMLEEQVNSQESELRVTADSIQTLDPATGALNPVIAIDNIVFCDFLDIGSIEDDDESAFVIVQQDPIYELVVAHFYSSLKKNSVKILKVTAYVAGLLSLLRRLLHRFVSLNNDMIRIHDGATLLFALVFCLCVCAFASVHVLALETQLQ
eukprot:m.41125 g.41125  ORF g.41125 m.41125 type:complete len:278 (+) comp10516_c0_seq3:129-962(+)